jgi:hypothetical protein
MQSSTGAGTLTMDDTQTDQSRESEGKKIQPVSGLEINIGDFTRTSGLLKSLRLVLNNQIVVQVEEVASGVGEAGRKFKMGDVEQSNHDVGKLYSAFRQKINQWECQARNLEQQMRMQSAKNPKSVSIDTMNRMKSEQIAVRTRIRTAEVQFRRLHQGVEQAFTNLTLKRQLDATSEASLPLPSSFLVAFKAATVADRSEVLKEWFDIESVVKITISRDAKAGFKIKFDSKPPLDRLYFLSMTAQVIRLQKLNPIVLFENLETGQNSEMKLKEFVKHVQNGVWLLKPRF